LERRFLVDSGADMSMISLEAAERLVVSFDTLPRTSSRGTAGSVECTIAALRFELCGMVIDAPVLVPMSRSFTSYILGREPFFRLLHFGFAQYEDPTRNLLLWRPNTP
jgi:hypothetical protein